MCQCELIKILKLKQQSQKWIKRGGGCPSLLLEICTPKVFDDKQDVHGLHRYLRN